MAKWIWPVMIEMPDDYDFDGASDDEKRALQAFNALMVKNLALAVRKTVWHEETFWPSGIEIGTVMLPGRCYGWDVTGTYQAIGERIRKELSDGQVSPVRKDDAEGRDVPELRL